MLYSFLKIIVRPAMFIFCRKVFVSKPELLKEDGPLLLACNHPNSFLDAIILDMLFDKPIWSLARGDVFKNKFINRILTSLRILPVYRTSEGIENLSVNYTTFDSCMKIFREKGIVCIFSEGKCINEWRLRKLKKGTARLAIRCWQENIPLRVLPVGINYSSFTRFGKNIYLNFGNIIYSSIISDAATDGLQHQAFNERLNTELKQLVFDIPKEDKESQKKRLAVRLPALKKLLLVIPAIPGYLIHLPFYLPIQSFTWKRTKTNDHYDSVLTALLLLLYPVYLLLLVLIAWYITKSWYVFSLLLLLPLSAWAYVQLKSQLDR